MIKKSALIVAGGKGLRMKQTEPKQFITLKEKPVIVHTIEAFLHSDPSTVITVVLARAYFNRWSEIKQQFFPQLEVHLAEGGATRFQSVRSGLEMIDQGLVAIHDAVRPLISPDVIKASYQSAAKTGSGVVMVPLKDSIRKIEGTSTRAEDRSCFYAVQTPQTFQVDLIKKAFDQDEKPTFTDDASVYESAGMEVSVVIGDYRNIKITTPEDLLIAEALM